MLKGRVARWLCSCKTVLLLQSAKGIFWLTTYFSNSWKAGELKCRSCYIFVECMWMSTKHGIGHINEWLLCQWNVVLMLLLYFILWVIILVWCDILAYCGCANCMYLHMSVKQQFFFVVISWSPICMSAKASWSSWHTWVLPWVRQLYRMFSLLEYTFLELIVCYRSVSWTVMWASV